VIACVGLYGESPRAGAGTIEQAIMDHRSKGVTMNLKVGGGGSMHWKVGR